MLQTNRIEHHRLIVFCTTNFLLVCEAGWHGSTPLPPHKKNSNSVKFAVYYVTRCTDQDKSGKKEHIIGAALRAKYPPGRLRDVGMGATTIQYFSRVAILSALQRCLRFLGDRL